MKDPYSDLLHKEVVKKLRGTDRWIYYRLCARGFRWLNSHSGDKQTIVWLWLPPEDRDPFHSCHLTVEIGNSYHNKVMFRPRSQAAVHVTRYVTLMKMAEWKDLEEFISFYKQHHDTLY